MDKSIAKLSPLDKPVETKLHQVKETEDVESPSNDIEMKFTIIQVEENEEKVEAQPNGIEMQLTINQVGVENTESTDVDMKFKMNQLEVAEDLESQSNEVEMKLTLTQVEAPENTKPQPSEIQLTLNKIEENEVAKSSSNEIEFNSNDVEKTRVRIPESLANVKTKPSFKFFEAIDASLANDSESKP